MAKQNLISLFEQNQQIQDWLDGFDPSSRQLVLGLSATSKALALASLLGKKKAKIVTIVASTVEAERLESDLIALVGEKKIYRFLAEDMAVVELAFSSKEREYTRAQALQFLQEEGEGIVIANLAALGLRLPDPRAYRAYSQTLTVGIAYPFEQILNQLNEMGYTKVGQVTQEGEYSQRGDILDLFPLGQELPYRLEFFGDELDNLRTFSPEHQRSQEKVESILIQPVRSQLVGEEDYERAEAAFLDLMKNQSRPGLLSYLQEILASIRLRSYHEAFPSFLQYFYEGEWSLLDYLPKNSLVIFDEFQRLTDKKAQQELEVAQYLTDQLQVDKALSRQIYFLDSYSKWRLYKPASFFSYLQRGFGNLKLSGLHQFQEFLLQDYFSQLPLIKDELLRFQKSGYTILLDVTSTEHLQTLQETLQDYNLTIKTVNSDEVKVNEIQFCKLGLSQGFQLQDQKLLLITEKELFQKKTKRRVRRQNISNAERLKSYQELEKGDYVVHAIHGIGQYLGIETIEVLGSYRDYVTVRYENGDRISLPVDQLDLLSKYIGSEGKAPKLNKLNDGRFQKAKRKVEKQVQDIADDLLKLYAARAQLKGFAFSPDGPDQEDFDQDFPYVETDDQLKSIQEIKEDMEKDKPMDRLLVGDVGFGKTEVAMRAAFKAVQDHKQVAVLVPTTVLAQQHLVNFQERFAEFAVEVDGLSRFKTKKEQAATLEKLAKGQVDIIIGTHRLLSSDVTFSDLGLIIIDEEQRFGVKHKEKLKELKNKVDVLTLTATPIPRTLHMSMLGIRDLSVIETPPTNRYPVQTFVMETNPQVIRDAVLREMERGGQAYYLYNRVDTIELKVAELQELIPEASIGYVHGRMSEVRLENTLLDFVNGVYDLLVTTTIIETGVDIPNANTLFIENADHMGLSTLYQLRGRVGRSNRIAYSYLFYRPDKSLSEASEKRLDAIKGFTELGSGFKIAMQDLSIRGAGNLLGSSQSGFIDSVGFELYSQLLEEAIAKKQGKIQAQQGTNAEISMGIDAYLPSEYIQDERHKIEIYKRIRQIRGEEDYQELQEELMDRFGEYPDPVAYLLEVGLLKAYADQIFIENILLKKGAIHIRFATKAARYFLAQDYFQALSQTTIKAQLSDMQGKMEVIFNLHQEKDYEILEALLQFTRFLAQELKEKLKDSEQVSGQNVLQ
ncbi:transcription-repair coupling factor [Streptococcus sp. 121]|uniref:transcription-repair coupling factor n=1 Tax=Streptococcus sp. 121 TaxID=2797637 RepID=UPI0018F07258|nr:transcription-repair coupling factor [Streptococcus sp. 121]MBJ6745759.1 transcription-repair coupling factor [Streptococcus sp. 121]